jgi:hypothetical protein
VLRADTEVVAVVVAPSDDVDPLSAREPRAVVIGYRSDARLARGVSFVFVATAADLLC